MERIAEDYVSYEVVKLLKEKGFNGKTHGNMSEIPCVCYITHQTAMKWLREECDLHIIAYPYNANGKKKWCCQVYKAFNLLGNEKYVNETLDSYEEAVEAALKYCLTYMI